MTVEELVAALVHLPRDAQVHVEVVGPNSTTHEPVTYYEQDDPQHPKVIILMAGEPE